MKMVQLSSGIVVNPDHVVSATVNSNYQTITVTTITAETFHIDRDYGKSVYETFDRLMKKLGDA